MILEVYKRKH